MLIEFFNHLVLAVKEIGASVLRLRFCKQTLGDQENLREALSLAENSVLPAPVGQIFAVLGLKNSEPELSLAITLSFACRVPIHQRIRQLLQQHHRDC